MQASARGQAELSGSWGRPLRAKQATRTGPGHTPGCTAGCPRQSEPCVSPSTFCSLRLGKSRGIWIPFLEAKLCYLISGTVPGEVTRESGLCLTVQQGLWADGAAGCQEHSPALLPSHCRSSLSRRGLSRCPGARLSELRPPRGCCPTERARHGGCPAVALALWTGMPPELCPLPAGWGAVPSSQGLSWVARPLSHLGRGRSCVSMWLQGPRGPRVWGRDLGRTATTAHPSRSGGVGRSSRAGGRT